MVNFAPPPHKVCVDYLQDAIWNSNNPAYQIEVTGLERLERGYRLKMRHVTHDENIEAILNRSQLNRLIALAKRGSRNKTQTETKSEEEK